MACEGPDTEHYELEIVSVADASSFSHGFFRRALAGSVPWPSNTVGGMSLIPGIGLPVCINSTICAKDVGYCG